jgi:hypothetical protein
MKKSNLKFFLIAAVLVLGVVVVSVYSCEKQTFVPQTTDSVSNDATRFITEPGAICGEMTEKLILKADDRAVGQALVYNDTKYFYVIMTPNKGYLLGNAFMEVGRDMKEIPSDGNRNPILSEYSYTIDSKPSSTFRKFRIPVSELTGNNFVSVAVEAVSSKASLNKSFMVWVEGEFMGTEQKGRIFTYTKQVCKTTPGQSNDAVE